MILHFVKHRKVAGSAGLSEAQDLPDEGESPEEIVLADERKRAVNDAVGKLSAEVRGRETRLLRGNDLRRDR